MTDGEFLKPDHDEWSVAETPKEALLSFIDAGAAGDEPVKGVMQCHIREWFDEIESLCLLSMALNRKLVLAETALHSIVGLTGRHDLPDAQVIAIRALERDNEVTPAQSPR